MLWTVLRRKSHLGPCQSDEGTEMLLRLVRLQTRFAALHKEDGATAVEYALMATLIAIVIIAGVTLFGRNLSTLFNKDATSV